MMRTLLLPLLLLFLSTVAHAGTECSQTVRTLGFEDDDCIFDAVIAPDGYIVATGYITPPGQDDRDLLLVKMTPLCGRLVWAWAYGASGDEVGRSIIVDHNGNLVVTGFTESIGNAPRSLMLSKFFSGSGQHVWTKVVTSATSSEFDLDGYCVIEDRDPPDELVITGDLYRHALSRYSLLMARFEADGDLDWIRSAFLTGRHHRGKALIEMCGHFNNDYAAFGCVEGPIIGERILLVNYAPNGMLQWGWWIDHDDTIDIDPQCAYGLTPTSGCGVCITGSTGNNLFVLRRDDALDYLWGYVLGDGIEGRAVTEAANNDIIVTGGSQGLGGNVHLARWQANGTWLWHKNFGAPATWDKGFSVLEEDVEQKIWIHGGTESWGKGDRDALIAKCYPDGSTCLTGFNHPPGEVWEPQEGQLEVEPFIPPVSVNTWNIPETNLTDTLDPDWIVCQGGACDVDIPSPEQTLLRLRPSAPNPTGSQTRITYAIPPVETPVSVSLRILDASGRLIRTLVDDIRSEGLYEVSWDATDERGHAVSRGVYYLELKCSGNRQSRRLVLVR